MPKKISTLLAEDLHAALRAHCRDNCISICEFASYAIVEKLITVKAISPDWDVIDVKAPPPLRNRDSREKPHFPRLGEDLL